MAKQPENFQKDVLFLAKKLGNLQYAFRGTTSLVLQGLEMNVDDIDILCDKKTALACNALLKDFLVEEVSLKQSDKFRSYFGRFSMEGLLVEVMGEWQIKDGKDNWSDPLDASERIPLKISDQEVFVTTIEAELSVFAKMGRWNAYQRIKKQVEDKQGQKQQKLF